MKNFIIKLLVSIVLCTTIFTVQASKTINKDNPYLMIREVAEITFNRFSREQAQIQNNPNILKTIVREELLPYIDYKYAAYKVIGSSNFAQTTEDEREAFVEIFREYLVTQYAQVFTRYKKQDVLFEEPQDFSNQKIVSVSTTIIEPGRDPINISFKVRKNRKTNEWKAFDMVVEGISLLDSKKAEFDSIIRQKGLSYVGNILKEKATRDIVLTSDNVETDDLKNTINKTKQEDKK
jgi:phospholipid transport system substrate-binding protein